MSKVKKNIDTYDGYFGVDEIAACIKMKQTKTLSIRDYENLPSDEIVFLIIKDLSSWGKFIKVPCRDQILSKQL